jgi:hypothetical protein
MAATLPEAKRPSEPTSAPDSIDERVAKLRELRGSLGRYQDIDRAVSVVPAARVRRWIYHRLDVEGARFLDSSAGLGATPPTAATAAKRRTSPRTGALLIALAATIGLAAVSYRTRYLEEQQPLTSPAPAPVAAVPVVPMEVAETLSKLPEALQPQGIWLVENSHGVEIYSNGLRIDTTYSVKGDPRRFRVFDATTGEMGAVQTEPMGILFHTSESDIWPLEEANNERLRHNSENLLKYLQRNRCYHYMIDRFGRVYRVVEEQTRANHAGYSVWRRDNQVFLNLNSEFVGICFETRWEGGHALPITKAQLSAGRDLTDYLRNRYKIPAEMCTAHGLASVNPKKHLIGHHIDWARGFPFEAFGLPDQYSQPDPAVTLFGFGYDEEFLGRMRGDAWKGVAEGEHAMAEEARQKGQSLDELRRQKRKLYDEWIAAQARDEQGESETVAARNG